MKKVRQSDRLTPMGRPINRKESDGKSFETNEDPLPPFSIDDCLESVPAAGWRNGSSLNNVGKNGNYWSATPNEDNASNAYNLNFNKGNFNRNWNNRNNGQSVRPVSELTRNIQHTPRALCHHISSEELLADLYHAYRDARKHKRGKECQLKFEFRLEDNLVSLRDDLISCNYKPRPSICFVIHDPKMREVFAADFRDRIVHHLFYNYTHRLFERTFIADSYSCITGRGTHYGIERLKHHIRSVSAGYSKPAYVMKIDIKGYFMSINRGILLSLCRDTLAKMARRAPGGGNERAGASLDFEFIDYLLETIITDNPIENCCRLGNLRDWDNLPWDKSIFKSPPGCGLPIGNLSSQLFSNVYMNVFDQFMKRSLRCRHYGRYVDDCYVVSDDRKWLMSLVPKIREFLRNELKLDVKENKLVIMDVKDGVEFLGAFVKPFRTYISNKSMHRIEERVKNPKQIGFSSLGNSVNSFLGVLSHYSSYRLRRVLFGHLSGLNDYGRFSRDWLTFRPYRNALLLNNCSNLKLPVWGIIGTGSYRLADR